MSGFEWFFAVLSVALMAGSLMLRLQEDRAMQVRVVRYRTHNPRFGG